VRVSCQAALQADTVSPIVIYNVDNTIDWVNPDTKHAFPTEGVLRYDESCKPSPLVTWESAGLAVCRAAAAVYSYDHPMEPPPKNTRGGSRESQPLKPKPMSERFGPRMEEATLLSLELMLGRASAYDLYDMVTEPPTGANRMRNLRVGGTYKAI